MDPDRQFECLELMAQLTMGAVDSHSAIYLPESPNTCDSQVVQLSQIVYTQSPLALSPQAHVELLSANVELEREIYMLHKQEKRHTAERETWMKSDKRGLQEAADIRIANAELERDIQKMRKREEMLVAERDRRQEAAEIHEQVLRRKVFLEHQVLELKAELANSRYSNSLERDEIVLRSSVSSIEKEMQRIMTNCYPNLIVILSNAEE